MPPARWRERIYTDETRLRGLEILIFLVHEGGLCLCSFYFSMTTRITATVRKLRKNPTTSSSWEDVKKRHST